MRSRWLSLALLVLLAGCRREFLNPLDPDAENYQGYVTPKPIGPITFSPPAAQYTGPLSVRIDTAEPGATIRYTTDGSEPDASSGTVYGGPISIDRSIELRAVAYMESGSDFWTEASAVASYVISPLALGAYEVYDGSDYLASGNGDGVANRNETVRLDISVRNYATGDLEDVVGTLSTASSLVSVDASNATKSFGTIYGSDSYESYAYYTYCSASGGHGETPTGWWLSSTAGYRITIPASTPDGSVVTLVLSLTDGQDNTYEMVVPFTVERLDGLPEVALFGFYDGTEYSASGDGDTVPNKGETVRMDVVIRNMGISDILGAVGTLSTSSPVVTIGGLESSKDYGRVYGSDYYGSLETSTYCSASGVRSNTAKDAFDARYAFLLSISAAAPDYEPVPLTLEIVDSAGNVWPLEFVVHVYPADSVVSSDYSLYDATSGSPLLTDGDGDYEWDPGETIRVNIKLRNTAATSATIVASTLTSENPHVQILDQASVAHGALNPGATMWLNGSSTASDSVWRLKLADSAPAAALLDLGLTITDGTTTWYDWLWIRANEVNVVYE